MRRGRRGDPFEITWRRNGGPITGCAIATGIIFASLLKSVSYAPDYEEVLFNYAILGFAFVETFSFFLFFAAAFIYVL